MKRESVLLSFQLSSASLPFDNKYSLFSVRVIHGAILTKNADVGAHFEMNKTNKLEENQIDKKGCCLMACEWVGAGCRMPGVGCVGGPYDIRVSHHIAHKRANSNVGACTIPCVCVCCVPLTGMEGASSAYHAQEHVIHVPKTVVSEEWRNIANGKRANGEW